MNKIITSCYIGKKGNENLLKYNCIWDTGASESMISDKVVKDLNLEKYGYVMLRTINNEKRSDKYLCSLSLMGHTQSISLNPTCFGKSREFDVIIGMDIISYGRFLIENDKFSFTIKSLL